MNRPKQKVSFAEKKKDEWLHPTVDYFRERCRPAVSDLDEYYKLYAVANGEIDELDYTHVTNPLNIEKLSKKGYPARMKNMDIISPNFQLMLAEKRQRPIYRQAVAVKTSDTSTQQKKVYQLWYEGLKQFHINELIQQGVAPEELEKQPPSLDMLKKAQSSIPDEFALQGQDALDYIDYYNDIPRYFVEGFSDYLICGQTYSYKDIQFEDIFYHPVPANEIYYLKDPTSTFLEDSECVIRRKYFGINDTIEKFHDEQGWTEEIENFLEAKISSNISPNSTAMLTQGNWIALAGSNLIKSTLGIPDGYINPDNSIVEHIVFKSWTQIYVVTSFDVFGNVVTEEYDEDYIPAESDVYETKWVTEFYEVYVLDERFYVGFKPIQCTRAKINNPNASKNLYNGRVFAARHNKPNSWIRKGLAYQFKYNTVYYHLEKTLAKNRDKIIIFPVDLMPDDEGYDETTTMYYADAHGWMFVDTEGDSRKMNALNGIKVLDASLHQYIGSLFDILGTIKQQWDAVVGINEQRKGDVAQTAGKGTTQEAVFRSSMMSENIFAEFDEFQQKEYQGLLDLSKYAWINGKKATFRTSDGRIVSLDLDPEKYASAEYGVFIDNSAEIQRQNELIKQLAFAQAQKSEKTSAAVKMVKSKNIDALIQELERLENEFEQRQAAAQQEQNNLVTAELEQRERHHVDEMDLKYYEIDTKSDTTIEAKLIDADVKTLGADMNSNNVDDSSDIADASVKREAIASKERIENNKLKVEKMRIEADKFIARVNKN
jgi:hypothetical protein